MSSSPFSRSASFENYEYLILHGKRDIADVIKLIILTREEYPRLSRMAEYNDKGRYKKEAGV